MSEWYETFFDGLYGRVLGSERHEDKARSDTRTIRRVLKLRKGRRVLDCPCGLGRITLQLARKGLDVTGADLTDAYIRRARRRARAEGLDVNFVRCDMRELPFESEFDAVVNWFTSFGYFDDAGDLAAARAAFVALRPGGKFLIDMMNKSWLLAHFDGRRREELLNGVRITNRPRWDARSGCVRDTWAMSKRGRTARTTIRLRLYDGAEIRDLLRKSGFGEIRLFGRPPLGRFTRHSRRMIAVAVKPVE